MEVSGEICHGRRKVVRFTSDGTPFEVWEKTMPRIFDEILDSVIYLYHTEEDANAGTQAGASGFLTAIPMPGDTTTAWIYAVSNRHVCDEAPVIRVNKVDGTVNVYPFRPDDWVKHPDGRTDLAVVN